MEQYDELTPREQDVLHLIGEGLSNQEIADELYLSVGTVKWYNKQIFSKLAVNNRVQASLRARELGILSCPRPVAELPQRQRGLPAQTTPFIGRTRELAEVRQLLAGTRLLTLIGPGGTGKTRLALQAAGGLADDFADGVYFVPLAPIRDPALVADTVVKALVNVTEQPEAPLADFLKRYLRDRELLLVLDNFEQIIEAAPVVGELLAAAPRLKLMVTSREALRLRGEQEYSVLPLALPGPDIHQPLSMLTQYESVALFIQQAQAVKLDFKITEVNAPIIVEICTRLDGLPLAIELAAAQVRLFSPEKLLARLEHRLNALSSGPRDAPARQQTLRKAIAWSYDLLDEDEQMLFARLGVFVGGCTLEAAEAVCGLDLHISVLDGLASLLHKSLIQQREDFEGEPRFTMLGTLREYAVERLEADGDLDNLRQRYAEYYKLLVERAHPELMQSADARWLDRLENELDNLRAVLRWAVGDGDVVLGLELMPKLWRFWLLRGHYVEGNALFERLVEKGGEAPQEILMLAKAYLATSLEWQGELARAEALYQETLITAHAIGDKPEVAWSLAHLGTIAIARADHERAERFFGEALALFGELDHKAGLAWAFSSAGEMAANQKDHERARMFLDNALALYRELGNQAGAAQARLRLAVVERKQGNFQRARALLRDVLVWAQARTLNAYIRLALSDLAGLLVITGQPERGARLFGAMETIVEQAGLSDRYLRGWAPDIALCREQLDPATFEALWAEGRAMSLQEAIDYALEEEEQTDNGIE